jgi:hypothetical protein
VDGHSGGFHPGRSGKPMNRVAEPAPTKDELVRAIDDLFYAAQQSALFVDWEVVEGPIVSSLGSTGIPSAKTLRNGIIESSLLFIRKTTEFFKPRHPQDQPDTIFAYSYLPRWTGVWVIREGDYAELHKRVGHITIREARYGKRDWPLVEFILAAIEQWIGFFSEVSQSHVFDGDPPTEKLNSFILSLQEVSRGCRSRFADQQQSEQKKQGP